MRSRTMMIKMAVMVAVVLVGVLFLLFFFLHVPIDGCDVVAREHARLAVAASFPPVGVRVVQDLDEVATSETQLAFLLGVKVKKRLHVCRVLGDLLYVSQKDLLIAGDRSRAVVIHQLIKGVELHHPKEILPGPITKNLEMLDIISKLHRQGEVSWRTLALSDEKSPVVPLFVQHLLCFGAGNLSKEPRMGFHLYVILGNESIFSI